jgi:hypothetical protein
MLKNVSKLMRTPKKFLSPREAANQHLGIQFGWLPLVDDVHSLLNVGQYINRRKDELHRLYSGAGLKRRLHLGKWTADTQSLKLVESASQLQINTRLHSITHVDRWGTVRWKPSVTPGHHPSDVEILKLARQVALGMTTEATMLGAWDLIPWTWLINWFTNVKSFASQYSNTVPASSESANVMTHTQTQEFYKVISITSGYTGGGGSRTIESKSRYVGSATLDAHIPFLNGSRLSILGSLFVQRFLR